MLIAAAIRQEVPDLILMSALLSPTDEDDLFDCLKSLSATEHVQTLTIPQFRMPTDTAAKSKFSFLRGRRTDTGPEGCDPSLFAREVTEYLNRASTLKGEIAIYTSAAVENQPCRQADIDVTDDRPATELDLTATDDTGVAPSIFLPDDTDPALDGGAASEVSSRPSIFLSDGDPSVVEDTTSPRAGTMRGADHPADAPVKDARKAAEAESKQALQAELARVQREHDDRLAAELDRAREDADVVREELLAASELKAEQIREETEAKTLVVAEADAQQALDAELARLRTESNEHLEAELRRVRSEADQALATQLAEASAEADRARADATRQAREVAEATAERTLQAEIERVRADTEKTLADGLLKLRREEDERRERQLNEITSQVAKLKEAAAEQAKTAAAEALKSELNRVREAKVVQERVIRLAPEDPAPVAPRVAAPIPSEPTGSGSDESASSSGVASAAPRGDYYSLFRDIAAETESDEDTRPLRRRMSLRRVVVGVAAAAVLGVGLFMGTGGIVGTGGAETPATGFILIDAPPGSAGLGRGPAHR